MKTLNALKLRIMTRAFRIRIANGEDFADIAAEICVFKRNFFGNAVSFLNCFFKGFGC